VLLANKYPLDWINVFPRAVPDQYASQNKGQKKGIRTVLIAAAALVVVVAIGFLALQRPWEALNPALITKPSVLPPEEIYARYKKSVVLIMGAYYFEVNDRGTRQYYAVDDRGRIVRIYSDDNAMFYTGTGFIVSNDGRIVTNKHVASPWEYDDDIITAIKNITGKVNVEGRLAFIGCFLNDTYVSGMQDLIRCTVLKTGATNDIDVAVLQTNSKTLPSGTGTIIDLNEAVVTDDELVIGSSVFTIGFPAGFALGRTEQGIQANNQDGKITQLRGDVEFGHNIAVEHGASGSPVFNQYGNLAGIINAGYEAKQGYNMAIKAKYAFELMQ
jgi:S1-C subfamily serine protease